MTTQHSPQKPTVTAMLFCDAAILDARTRRMSLVNMIFEVPVVGVPILYPKITLFLSLTSGHGRQSIRVQLEDPAGETIKQGSDDVEFPDPLGVRCQVFEFPNVHLKHLGDYTATVYWGDEILEQARFKVFKPNK
ncbi:MAG: hypothetical protein JXL80_06740 [Planctomycetes bacterium]|nr:hypothetical protein [Planctomycetota bacterium]